MTNDNFFHYLMTKMSSSTQDPSADQRGILPSFWNLGGDLFDFAPQCFALGGIAVPLNLRATCPFSMEMK